MLYENQNGRHKVVVIATNNLDILRIFLGPLFHSVLQFGPSGLPPNVGSKLSAEFMPDSVNIRLGNPEDLFISTGHRKGLLSTASTTTTIEEVPILNRSGIAGIGELVQAVFHGSLTSFPKAVR